MTKLGLGYSVDDINNALSDTQNRSNNRCVGLKIIPPPYNERKKTHFDQEINNLLINAVYYDGDPLGSFYEETINMPVSNFYVSNNADAISRTDGNTSNARFESWSDTPKIDFIYFGKQELEHVMIGVTELVISGAAINYGDGLRNYFVGTYPTLKAQSVLSQTSRNSTPIPSLNINLRNIPNVQLGLPCPPDWRGSFSSIIRNLSFEKTIPINKYYNNILNAWEDFIGYKEEK